MSRRATFEGRLLLVAAAAAIAGAAAPGGFRAAGYAPGAEAPPRDTLRVRMVERASLGRGLARGAVIVVERAKRDPLPAWPAGVQELQQRRYGDTLLWYGRRSVDPAADVPSD